jgi:hypothetical protein
MRVGLLTLAGVGYRGKAFPKIRLLSLRFLLLIQFPRLLFGTRSRGCAARQEKDNRRRGKHEYWKLFHKNRLTIVSLTEPAITHCLDASQDRGTGVLFAVTAFFRS